MIVENVGSYMGEGVLVECWSDGETFIVQVWGRAGQQTAEIRCDDSESVQACLRSILEEGGLHEL